MMQAGTQLKVIINFLKSANPVEKDVTYVGEDTVYNNQFYLKYQPKSI